MKKGVLLFLLLIGFPVAAFAAVNVLNRTVMPRITRPDGTFVSVTPMAALPKILDGAILEIPSYVADNLGADVVIAGQTLYLTSGDRIQIMADEPKGGFNVLIGEVSVTTPDGQTKILTGKPAIESYKPPAIPDPKIVDQQIQADEAIMDISPISQ